MDSPTFVKRVAELSGVDKEIAERVVRGTLLNLGTRIDLAARITAPSPSVSAQRSPTKRSSTPTTSSSETGSTRPS
jgi:type IV secretory pathway ATPase VirB11/archaellum biosynthesis ATPase